MPRQNHRVVLTGTGAVTPFGEGIDVLWDGLSQGRSAVDRVSQFGVDDLPVQIAAEVRGFDPLDYMDARTAKRTARFTHLAWASTKMALAESQLDIRKEDSWRVGVEMGNAVGSLGDVLEQHNILLEKGARRIVPTTVPSVLINMGACNIAMMLGARGPASAPVAACATGIYAIGEAARRLERGDVDVMIAGGTEAILNPLAMAAFWRIQALSTTNDDPQGACRPFDVQRNGTVMGEGAAAVILETEEHALARGAPILAEVSGYGISEDAFHLIAPEPAGHGAAHAMQLALRDASLQPQDVDYISAHGTGTPLNDLSETLAIKEVFGEAAYQVPISSIKSMVGHTLGAAGAVSAVASVLVIQNGLIPPTINLTNPDPQCDLDYVPLKARPAEVDVVMNNAFGFGGQNGCLIIQRYTP